MTVQPHNEDLTGYWYVRGPADRPFNENDPDFKVIVVVDTSLASVGFVRVRGPEGECYPVPADHIREMASPPGMIFDSRSGAYIPCKTAPNGETPCR